MATTTKKSNGGKALVPAAKPAAEAKPATTALAVTPAIDVRTKIKAPPPGVYEGITFEEYAAWEAVNHSSLRLADRSRAHVRCAMDEPGSDTAAMAFGRALHMCVFEPERAGTELAVAPINPSTGESYGFGTQKYLEAAAANPGKTLIGSTSFRRMRAMAEAINANALALELVGRAGRSELSIVWDEDGVPCKARIDRVLSDEGGDCLVDLKSTLNASPAAFGRSMVDYGYHTGAAWYRRGWAALHGGRKPAFRLLAVESEPPHGVAVYSIRDEALILGEQRVNELFAVVAAGMLTGDWPGYPAEVVEIDLPRWEYAKFTEGE